MTGRDSSLTSALGTELISGAGSGAASTLGSGAGSAAASTLGSGEASAFTTVSAAVGAGLASAGAGRDLLVTGTGTIAVPIC